MDNNNSENLKDLRLNKKYLLVTNLILLLMLFGEVQIGDINLMGTKLIFKNKNFIFYALVSVFAYSLLRYWQYYLKVEKNQFKSELDRFTVEYLKSWYFKDLKNSFVQPNDSKSYDIRFSETEDEAGRIKVTWWSFIRSKSIKTLNVTISKQELTGKEKKRDKTTYSRKHTVKKNFEYYFLSLRSKIWFSIKNPSFFDSLFPFLLSLITVILYMVKNISV